MNAASDDAYYLIWERGLCVHIFTQILQWALCFVARSFDFCSTWEENGELDVESMRLLYVSFLD